VRWPLTGLESSTPIDHPALAVKIENSVDARPQTGLGAADLVWEEVVQGGITRYVAVYHSTLPPEVGPVRSIRAVDPSIAAPLHGLFAFSGGQQAYIGGAAAAGLQLLSNDAGGAQFDVAAAGGQPTTATAGTPVTSLQLTLSGASHPRWTWSEPDGRWLRAEGSTPAVEADGTPLRATDVVVLRVDVVPTSARDPAGNLVPATVTDRMGLTGSDGNPVLLAPGNTWVELVPNGTGAVTVG
jgi:hypothetical protein